MTSASKTYVIVGSGPSLTKEQIEIARKARSDGKCQIIVINDNYLLIPDADYLFACDLSWWRRNYDKVCETVSLDTRLHTVEGVVDPLMKNKVVKRYIEYDYVTRNINDLKNDPDVLYHGGCSGILAMELARLEDITIMNHNIKLILIGFDFQHTNGKAHWFGDHPKGMINASNCERWVREIHDMMPYYKSMGIDVVNCSNESAINPETIRRSTIQKELFE